MWLLLATSLWIVFILLAGLLSSSPSTFRFFSWGVPDFVPSMLLRFLTVIVGVDVVVKVDLRAGLLVMDLVVASGGGGVAFVFVESYDFTATLGVLTMV